MVEAAVQAICEGDREKHLSMHQRHLDDALIQAQKRRFHIDANIVMGDEPVDTTTFRVI